jgi:hypothetical protein
MTGSANPVCAWGRWLLSGGTRKAKCPARAALGSIYCAIHRNESLRRVAARARA